MGSYSYQRDWLGAVSMIERLSDSVFLTMCLCAFFSPKTKEFSGFRISTNSNMNSLST